MKKNALQWLEELADDGIAEAQYLTGLFYYRGGICVDEDYEKAFFWFKKSAEQGNAEAQQSLGNCYSQGYGVPMDYEQKLEIDLLATQMTTGPNFKIQKITKKSGFKKND